MPKKSDLGFLKNWGPVSLLRPDYEIFATRISNRLTKYIDIFVDSSQTYCVSERRIMDNAFCFGNIDLMKFQILHVGLPSIVQEKKMYGVDHNV